MINSCNVVVAGKKENVVRRMPKEFDWILLLAPPRVQCEMDVNLCHSLYQEAKNSRFLRIDGLSFCNSVLLLATAVSAPIGITTARD